MSNIRLVKKIISVVSCAVAAALFIVIFFFCAPEIAAIPETEGRSLSYDVSYKDENGNRVYEIITAVAGEDFTAVSIADLGKLNRITKVNYVADEFVYPCDLSSDIQIVDLEKPFEFAEKGTLIFVVFNLDPFAEDFYDKRESLSEFKRGNDLHFAFSLPEIFCACNVYLRMELVARQGNIKNYDFARFNDDYNIQTDSFSQHAENMMLDLSYNMKDIGLSPPKIITVHYQSTGGLYSGIADCPLIGAESAVKSMNESSKNLLGAVGILSAVVFAVLVVLSLLKHSKESLPSILWIFGIALLLLSRFFLAQPTGAPLLWIALWLTSSFIILGGALLSMSVNLGKISFKFIFPALAAVGALFTFISPFIPFSAASVLEIVCLIIKIVCIAALFCFTGFSIFRKNSENNILKSVCAAIIAVALCASLFLPQIFPAQTNPIFWLCMATVIITFVNVFMVFKRTERANEYLTANLHSEVERQIKDIKAVIQERDNLLQFVSHDMRKPLISSASMIDTLIEHEKDEEQTKGLQIVQQNTARVVSNLTEIAVYAKFNYLAEPSQVTDLFQLCDEFYEFHKPDCNANGIVFKNLVNKSVKVFVKRKGLENVVSNLIINAIEHANCKTITLSVKTDKNKIVLSVSDDGKGIDESLDVFRPYVSENNTETGGLGLYICKNIIESMNGELTYVSTSGGTVFYISLLKA